VYVRVWEYEVPRDRTGEFAAAYAVDGLWGELFGQAVGYLGTELYHDSARPGRFLTIDRWRDERAWQAFLADFRPDYETLDTRLEGIAAAERSLFEGSS